MAKKIIAKKTWLYITAFILSLVMLAVGFALPPPGVIDGSVLSACGLLLGSSVVYSLIDNLPSILQSYHSIRLTHNDSSLELNS